MNHRELRAGCLSLIAHFEEDFLRKIDLPKEAPSGFSADDLRDMLEQLEQFPISFEGAPPFHQRIWKRLRQIKWGAAMTYAELARAVDSPHAFRAVGQACGANPLPLIVPCHRVVGGNGIGGFSGGAGWKERLLDLEAGQTFLVKL